MILTNQPIDQNEISVIEKETESIFSLIETDENSEGFVKTASSKNDDEDEGMEEQIMFTSKEIEHPHYEVFTCLTTIKKNNKSLIMVSFYMKESYLGRYLIKRNFYFLKKSMGGAKKLYKNFVTETKKTRRDYYDDEIMHTEIVRLLQNYINESSGDFKSERDSIGTTVKRTQTDSSTVTDWFYRNKTKQDEYREVRSGVVKEKKDYVVKSAIQNNMSPIEEWFYANKKSMEERRSVRGGSILFGDEEF